MSSQEIFWSIRSGRFDKLAGLIQQADEYHNNPKTGTFTIRSDFLYFNFKILKPESLLRFDELCKKNQLSLSDDFERIVDALVENKVAQLFPESLEDDLPASRVILFLMMHIYFSSFEVPFGSQQTSGNSLQTSVARNTLRRIAETSKAAVNAKLSLQRLGSYMSSHCIRFSITDNYDPPLFINQILEGQYLSKDLTSWRKTSTNAARENRMKNALMSQMTSCFRIVREYFEFHLGTVLTHLKFLASLSNDIPFHLLDDNLELLGAIALWIHNQPVRHSESLSDCFVLHTRWLNNICSGSVSGSPNNAHASKQQAQLAMTVLRAYRKDLGYCYENALLSLCQNAKIPNLPPRILMGMGAVIQRCIDDGNDGDFYVMETHKLLQLTSSIAGLFECQVLEYDKFGAFVVYVGMLGSKMPIEDVTVPFQTRMLSIFVDLTKLINDSDHALKHEILQAATDVANENVFKSLNRAKNGHSLFAASIYLLVLTGVAMEFDDMTSEVAIKGAIEAALNFTPLDSTDIYPVLSDWYRSLVVSCVSSVQHTNANQRMAFLIAEYLFDTLDFSIFYGASNLADRVDLEEHVESEEFKYSPYVAKAFIRCYAAADPKTQIQLLWTVWFWIRYLHGFWRWYTLLPEGKQNMSQKHAKKMHDWTFLFVSRFLSRAFALLPAENVHETAVLLDILSYLEFFHIKSTAYNSLLSRILRRGRESEELVREVLTKFFGAERLFLVEKISKHSILFSRIMYSEHIVLGSVESHEDMVGVSREYMYISLFKSWTNNISPQYICSYLLPVIFRYIGCNLRGVNRGCHALFQECYQYTRPKLVNYLPSLLKQSLQSYPRMVEFSSLARIFIAIAQQMRTDEEAEMVLYCARILTDKIEQEICISTLPTTQTETISHDSTTGNVSADPGQNQTGYDNKQLQKFQKQIPERILRLLVTVIQWMPLKFLYSALDIVEELFVGAPQILQQQLFEVFYRDLSSGFNGVTKEICVEWFGDLHSRVAAGQRHARL